MATFQHSGDPTGGGGGNWEKPSANVFSAPDEQNVFSAPSQPNVFSAPGESQFSESKSAHHGAPPGHLQHHFDWSQLLDRLAVGVVVINGRQELVYGNRAYRSLTGYDIRQCGGIENWLRAMCPDDKHAAKVLASWRNHVWRNQLTRTYSLKCGDGKMREIQFEAQLGEDGGLILTLQDVTQAGRTEEALRHGKMKFRAVFGHSSNGTVLVDKTGRIIDANPAFLSLVGIPLSELRLSSFHDLLQSGDAEALMAVEEELLKNSRIRPGESMQRPVFLKTKKGDQKIEITICPVVGREGDYCMGVYLFSSLDNQAEAQETSKQLKKLAEKAKALLDSVPDLILLINREGLIVDFSPPSKSWDELEIADDWKGSLLSDVWPAFADLLDRVHGRVFEKGKSANAELRSAKGLRSSFSVTFSAIGKDEAIASVRNTTEIRKLQEAIGWRQLAFEKTRDAMLLTDLKGRVQLSNKAAETMLSRRKEEILGERLSTFFTGNEEEADVFNAHLSKRLTSDGSWAGCENIHFPDGTVHIADIMVLPVEEDGIPHSLLNVIRPYRKKEDGFAVEAAQHQFRNQLQTVTSLFALEPQSPEALQAFLKWQIRLRALAAITPSGQNGTVRAAPLIREIADEVANLSGKGPGRKVVVVAGSEDLSISYDRAASFGLLMGEIMRLVIGSSEEFPGPILFVDLGENDRGKISVVVRPAPGRRLFSAQQESEATTLDLLARQIQAVLRGETGPEREKMLVLELSK